MSNLVAVFIGALIGVGGVIAGTWLQGRKEHQRWLRDEKLRAAVGFIGATSDARNHRARFQPATRCLEGTSGVSQEVARRGL